MLFMEPWTGSSRLQSSRAISSSEHSRPAARNETTSSLPTILGQPSDLSQIAASKPRKLLKRPRMPDDSESEERRHVPRKKRRLRLELVTSRLSNPYAAPATHIIGTKPWRIGIWARQRLAGGKLLRKAALLNSVAMKRKRGPTENSTIKNMYVAKWEKGS